MIITSEITGKQYKTVDACVADERKFIAEKEARDSKADAAFNEVVEAWANYKKVLREAGFKISPIDEIFCFLEVIENDKN